MELSLLSFALYLGICANLIAGQEENPLLTIKQGTLLGKFGDSRIGRRFYEFRSIPFGHIPQRFLSAVAAGSWDNVRNATQSNLGCIRWDPLSVIGASGIEDCLDLDVFTPTLPRDPNYQGPMPVIVFITGGGFISGIGATYGPKYFMDEDVILVNINFRLGAFGLLNAGIDSARGNQALKDQVLALKWLQTNIADFGGDPAKVTIMGESTGGGSVSFHTFSPMSRGLFSGAVMQSGIAPLPQVFHGNPPLKYAKMLAGALDCPTRNIESLVACLRNTPAHELASLSSIPTDGFGWTHDGIHLSSTIETYTSGPNDTDVFISADPFLLAQGGDFEKVPMIIGMMAFENIQGCVTAFTDNNVTERYNREFEFYLKGQNVSLETVWEFERMNTDRLMTHNMRKTAAEYAKHTKVYMYNFTRPIANHTLPPSHAYDLYYLFNFVPVEDYATFPEIKPGDEDFEFSRQLIKMFVTFAKNGNPGRLWGNIGGEWPHLVPGQRQQWLQVDENPFMMAVDQTFMDSWAMYDGFDLNGYGEV